MTQLIYNYESVNRNIPRGDNGAFGNGLERVLFQHNVDASSDAGWNDGGVVLRADPADTFDDRVSDDIYDVDDEHAEVAIIESRFSRSSSFA